MPQSTNSADEIPPGLAALQESVQELNLEVPRLSTKSPSKRSRVYTPEGKRRRKKRRVENESPCRTPDSVAEPLSDTGRLSALSVGKGRKQAPLSDSKIVARKPRIKRPWKIQRYDPVLPDSEIDRILEETAAKNNLSAINVKTILKNVLSNSSVKKLLHRRLREAGQLSVGAESDDTETEYEPKLTRARKKAILGPSAAASSTNREGSRSETRALMDQDFPDDSSDEEYKPENTNIESEDESYVSSQASDIGSPIAPGKMAARKSSTEPLADEDGFKVPRLPEPRALSFDMQELDIIGLRTRSKHQIDTPIEYLEATFNPPDITADMYDSDVDDVFKQFLVEFQQPSAQRALTQDEEEEQDPEYNVLEDKEDIDREELRYDRSVRISKNEVKELITELFDTFDIEEEELIDEAPPKRNDVVMERSLIEDIESCPTTPLVDRGAAASLLVDRGAAAPLLVQVAGQMAAVAPPNIIVTVCLPSETHKSVANELSCVAEEAVPSAPLFSAQMKLRLEEQLRKHVQILTQTHLITCQQPKLFTIRDKCMTMLSDLDFRRIISLPFSPFNIFNIEEAIKLTANWKLYCENHPGVNSESRTAYSLIEKDGQLLAAKPLSTKPHPELIKRMLESRVFIYPELLPVKTFFKEDPDLDTNYWAPSEVMLLSQGLEMFTPWVKENCLLSSKRERKRTICTMIAQHMTPSHSQEEVFQKLRKFMAPTARSNPLKFYRLFGVAPPISDAVTPFFPKEAMPLGRLPVSHLPRPWQKIVASLEDPKVTNGKARRRYRQPIIYQPVNLSHNVDVKCACSPNPQMKHADWVLTPKRRDTSTNTDDFVYSSDETEDSVETSFSEKYHEWLAKHQSEGVGGAKSSLRSIEDWLARSDTASVYSRADSEMSRLRIASPSRDSTQFMDESLKSSNQGKRKTLKGPTSKIDLSIASIASSNRGSPQFKDKAPISSKQGKRKTLKGSRSKIDLSPSTLSEVERPSDRETSKSKKRTYSLHQEVSKLVAEKDLDFHVDSEAPSPVITGNHEQVRVPQTSFSRYKPGGSETEDSVTLYSCANINVPLSPSPIGNVVYPEQTNHIRSVLHSANADPFQRKDDLPIVNIVKLHVSHSDSFDVGKSEVRPSCDSVPLESSDYPRSCAAESWQPLDGRRGRKPSAESKRVGQQEEIYTIPARDVKLREPVNVVVQSGRFINPVPSGLLGGRIRIVQLVTDSPIRTHFVVKEEADSTTSDAVNELANVVVESGSESLEPLPAEARTQVYLGSDVCETQDSDSVSEDERMSVFPEDAKGRHFQGSGRPKDQGSFKGSGRTGDKVNCKVSGRPEGQSTTREIGDATERTNSFPEDVDEIISDGPSRLLDKNATNGSQDRVSVSGKRSSPKDIVNSNLVSESIRTSYEDDHSSENGAAATDKLPTTERRSPIQQFSSRLAPSTVHDRRLSRTGRSVLSDNSSVIACAGATGSEEREPSSGSPRTSQATNGTGSGTVLSFTGAFSGVSGEGGGAGGDDGDERRQPKKVPDDGEPESRDGEAPTCRKSKKKKKRSQKAADPETVLASLSATPDDISFAHSYIERVQAVTSEETYEHFIELLQSFDENLGAIELYREVLKVLKGYDELANEFIAFLTPEEAQRCGKIFEKSLIDRMREFFAVLMAYFKGQPAHVRRIVSTLTSLQAQAAAMEKVKLEVIPLLRGHVYLQNLFLSLLPPEEPHFNEDHKAEEVVMNSSDSSNDFEVVRDPSFEEEPIETPANISCHCSCHQASANPEAHCYDCGLKFAEDKVYIKTDSGLKLATVRRESDSQTPPCEVLPSGQKPKKRPSPRSKEPGGGKGKTIRRIAPTFIGPRGTPPSDST